MQGPEKRITPALTVSQALEQALAHHDRGDLAEAERLYAAILGVDAEDADALHLLGVLRKQQRRYDEAIRLIGAALERDPEYVEAHVNLGLALSDVRRHDEAIDSYRKALAIDPGCAAAHYNMGLALAARGRREEAVASYRGALAANPGYFEAHFNLAITLHGLRRRDEAVASLRRTLEIKPDYARAHFTLGIILQEAGRLAEAEVSYRGALAIQPDHSEAHGCLGLALQGQGRMAEAEASYRQALAFHPGNADLHNNLGVTLKEQGRYEEAGESFRRALAIVPQYAEVHSNLGSALHGQGRLAEAEESYRRALSINPGHAEVHRNLGSALLEQGRFTEAEDSYRRALEIKPDYAVAHSNLGNALKEQGRFAEAEESCHRALAINPDFADAHNNVGTNLAEQGRFAAAEASYRRALALNPDFAEAHSNLGDALRWQGRLDEAEASHRRALELKPDYHTAHNNLANVLVILRRLPEAEAGFRRALALKPDSGGARSNLLLMLNYTDRLSRAELFEEHLDWARRHEAPLAAQHRPHANSRDPYRALRVGYVSPDFRRHSVAYFIEPVLAGHDRNAFTVHCYSNVANPDRMTQRLTALADAARSIVGMSDARAAELVRADGIDILIDLAGHTARGRLGLFALKPAPVQVSYLGYPNTSGLRAMDWRLTDVHADPPGNGDEFHSERLARLQQSFLCFRPPQDAPDVQPAPFIRNGRVTFGSFNARQKVTPELIRAWAQLLVRVPDSRLLLKGTGLGDTSGRGNVVGEFARHGIGEDRLMLLPHDRDFSMHLAHYHEVDIALDPFPYNGATTTLEALWMGVPVVSLAGDRHAGRVGVSILSNVNLDQLIAKSAEEYLALAAGLAEDGARLASLRGTMRERVAASPLRDEASFARALERAYREMWQHWCASETAANGQGPDGSTGGLSKGRDLPRGGT